MECPDNTLNFLYNTYFTDRYRGSRTNSETLIFAKGIHSERLKTRTRVTVRDPIKNSGTGTFGIVFIGP